MAKYDRIWQQLKETGKCTVTVPIQLQRRIVRGVIKAKDEDSAFKLQQLTAAKRSKISYDCQGNRVRFFLTNYVRWELVEVKHFGGSK